MNINEINKNYFLLTSALLLVLLYVYSQSYDYPKAIPVKVSDLNLVENGALVKITANVNVGNHTTICTTSCIFLNNYNGKTGVATVIGTLDRKKYTAINVLKTYQ